MTLICDLGTGIIEMVALENAGGQTPVPQKWPLMFSHTSVPLHMCLPLCILLILSLLSWLISLFPSHPNQALSPL